MYFVMDYVAGGEFFTHLKSRGRLTEEGARFYAAEVLMMFEYLHSQDIVYRDLKVGEGCGTVAGEQAAAAAAACWWAGRAQLAAPPTVGHGMQGRVVCLAPLAGCPPWLPTLAATCSPRTCCWMGRVTSSSPTLVLPRLWARSAPTRSAARPTTWRPRSSSTRCGGRRGMAAGGGNAAAAGRQWWRQQLCGWMPAAAYGQQQTPQLC